MDLSFIIINQCLVTIQRVNKNRRRSQGRIVGVSRNNVYLLDFSYYIYYKIINLSGQRKEVEEVDPNPSLISLLSL